MLACWHEKECNGYCPLFITNEEYKEVYGKECVIEMMLERITYLEQMIKQLDGSKSIAIHGKEPSMEV